MIVLPYYHHPLSSGYDAGEGGVSIYLLVPNILIDCLVWVIIKWTFYILHAPQHPGLINWDHVLLFLLLVLLLLTTRTDGWMSESADGLNIEDDEPPPEPAPPEIPPRGHSLLRSTSSSARKCSDYQIHVRDVLCADQKHEEFIPQEKQQGKWGSILIN